MSQNIITFILQYSVVQGYLLSIYIGLKLKYYYFATVLFLVATQILFHLYYQFEWFRQAPEIIFVESPLWYLIGPFFYFSILSLFKVKASSLRFIHFLPFLASIIYMYPFYRLPAPDKIGIFIVVFSLEGNDIDFNHYFFTAHIIIYLLISYRFLTRKSKILKDQESNSSLAFHELAINLLRYYLILFLAALIFYILSDFNFSLVRPFYLIFYLLISALIHLAGYYALILPKTGTSDDINDSKYSTSTLSQEQMNDINQLVRIHIDQFEIYKNPDLRLKNVAEALHIPSHHISQALSTLKGINFFDLVNKSRLEGFKSNIFKSQYKNYTLFAVASEHGFKSPSSFYRIFKKYEGITPKTWVKNQRMIK